MATKRKSSELWNHFKEITPNKQAKCCYCSRVLAIHSSSIGSLARHMKSVHSTIEINSSRQLATSLDNFTEEQPVASQAEQLSNELPAPLQIRRRPTMADFVVSKKPIPTSRVQLLDEQLVKLIAKGYHALRIVEEVEFRKFVEMLNPAYALPTRKTLSESLLPKVYNKLLESARSRVGKAAAICITTDAWTSIANDGYIAVTAHFIDTITHDLSTIMIGCIEFNEKHTSVNLKNFLEEKFSEWNIQKHINAIVSDNAANMLGAVRLGGWRSISCFAHTLNLVVQESVTQISDVVNRVKVVVEYFHRSSPGAKKLKEIQEQMNMSTLKLKQDVATRWNSTYDMLLRFLNIKEALIATLAIMRPDLSLPPEDWIVIEKATELLKIFYHVTVEVSGETYVTASKYIVFCKLVNRALSKFCPSNIKKIENLLNSLRSQMNARFGEVESNLLLCETTILDPRFKKNGFSNVENFNRAASVIKSRIGTQTTDPVQESVQNLPSVNSGQSDSVWDEFDAEIAVLVPHNATAAGIVEFDKYMAEPLLRRTENPLQWWKERKAVYPRLYKYMLKRLNITATSVPCERVFSKAGLTLNERRTRLQTKKLSQLVFISCN